MERMARAVLEWTIRQARAARQLLQQPWVRKLGYGMVGLAVLWWVVIVVRNFPLLREQIRSLDMRYLSASYLLLFVAIGLAASRWPLVVRAAGSECRFLWLFRTWFLAQAARHLPGGVWNYASAVALTSTEVRASTTAVGFAMDAVLRLAGDAIVISGFWLVDRSGAPWVILAAIGYLGALCIAALLLNWFLDGNGRLPGLEFDHGLPRTFLRRLVLPMGVSVLSSVLVGLAFWMFARSFPESEALTLMTAVWGMTVSDAAGFLVPFAPSGLGIREGLLTYWLAGPMTEFSAVLISGLSRVWFLSAEALFIAIVLGIFWLGRYALKSKAGEFRRQSSPR